MSYSDKLKDPRWQKKRLEILDRDCHKCTVCDYTKNLHVHHGYYSGQKDPWQYEDCSLHTLCSDCHDRTHDVLDRINRNIGLINPQFLIDGTLERMVSKLKFS